MSVVITNVSDHNGDTEISDYVVRINCDPPIATFEHWRRDGLAECLRRAADAVDAARAIPTKETAYVSVHPR